MSPTYDYGLTAEQWNTAVTDFTLPEFPAAKIQGSGNHQAIPPNHSIHSCSMDGQVPNVLENFDFDSFLCNTDSAPNFSFDFMNLEGMREPLHQIVLSKAQDVTKETLRAIVDIHKSAKGHGEENYPDDLQNLLLTSCRTVDTIAKHIEALPPTEQTVISNPFGVLLTDFNALGSICEQVRKDVPTVEIGEDGAHSKVWKLYERKVSTSLCPLLVYHGCLKNTNGNQGVKDISILDYLQFPREHDDAETEVGDTASVLSDATLLGVLEDKEKSKEYGTSVEVAEVLLVEEIRSKSYLCGLIRFSSSASVPKEGKPLWNDNTPLKKMTRAVTPAFIQKKQKASHEKKVLEARQTILDAAANATLHTLAYKTRYFIEAITGTDILLVAIKTRDENLVKWLLTRGAYANGVTAGDDTAIFTPLGEAVRGSTPAIVEALIQAGAQISGTPVGFRPSDREDALAHAVKWRRPQIVEILLRHKAFDNEVAKLHEEGGEELETSLHKAAADPDVILVLQVLLKNSRVLKYINLRAGPKMNTPLHYAAAANNVPAIKLLLASGAHLEARNIRLCTPLHWAIKHKRVEASIHLIRNAGADVNAPRVRLEPPLKYAVCNSSRELVEALVSRGARINEPTGEGKTALHSAASHECTSLVRTLLDLGADVNCRSKYGSTPLFLAAQNGRIATAKLLLENGADPTLGRTGHKSTKLRDPKYIAKRGENWEVLRLLECWERGEDFGPVEDDAAVEDEADDHSCSWEYWFEKYVVKMHEKDLQAAN